MRPFVLAGLLLMLAACTPDRPETCAEVTGIEGPYVCSGACVLGLDSLVAVSGETDTIRAIGDSAGVLYAVDIEGADDFRETEVGVLTGTTLRTATAAVSDSTYPVTEEYLFATDGACRAEGFTKVVRGLNPEAFKACAIECRREG